MSDQRGRDVTRKSLSAAEARQAVIGILSRPGTIAEQADEIVALLTRASRIDPEPEYCRNPAGPHSGTRLVNKVCPICGWSPDPLLSRAA